MVNTVPVLYYMFVIGGFLPLIAIVALSFLSFTGAWGFVFFNLVHILIYGALLYWIAKVVSKQLARLSHKWKIVSVACISTALCGISLLPVYSAGHHESQAVNLYRLFHSDLLK